ncbi:MAG: helix-turn-helix transcriptional regulator [Planctomycetes bacterium]|nr:helix-turn-helix transcriptional regulator [Planctomycetota bacterium]
MLPLVHQVAHHRGISPNKPGEFHECYHDQHVVGFKPIGSGWYQSGNELREVRAPFMGMLPKGELDRNGIVGPYEMYWVKFEWDAVKRQPGDRTVGVDLHGMQLRRSHWRALSNAEARLVTALFQDLLTVARRPDLSSRLRAGALVVDLIAFWTDVPAAEGGRERSVRIYRNLIEQYADAPEVSLAEIAERVGMSADHLGVLFQKDMGMTPVEYRTRMRLLRARELLVSTARPVREIAREVGFPNASHFTRLFRAAFGQSPRDYARTQAYVFAERSLSTENA